MNPSRQALALSMAYLLPLLIWLLAQLQYIEWSPLNLQHLFRQTLALLIPLQALCITLSGINRSPQDWQDEALAIIHIILFPLPVLALIWLTGGADLTLILNSLLLLSLFAAVIQLIQLADKKSPLAANTRAIMRSLGYLLLFIALWNFRPHWHGWLGL